MVSLTPPLEAASEKPFTGLAGCCTEHNLGSITASVSRAIGGHIKFPLNTSSAEPRAHHAGVPLAMRNFFEGSID